MVSERGLFQVDAQAFQHAGCNAVALPEEADEKVFSADVLVIEASGFVNGEFNDFLGPGR